MKASYNGTIIAESDETVVVDGNHYFPHDAIKKEFFSQTQHHTTCPWKGQACYYSITVDGKTRENGAWFYPQCKEGAKQIENYVAFYRDVTVSA
eukprot:m.336778 g.336778  ORF g.336778 m.336778 type:complete len:94 (-) comp17959_c0_seq1:98-379(-)